MKNWRVQEAFIVSLVFLLLGLAPSALADGTETLGPPNIPIASGSEILAAGTGLGTQPGTIIIDVPAPVKQVLLYWEGQSVDPFPSADQIVVNGIPVQGTSIGGPTDYGSKPWRTQSYRADITSLGLVTQGHNELSVEGLVFNHKNDGAGMIVLVDDGIHKADLQIRDGNDFAFSEFNSPLNVTDPQTFTFVPAEIERSASLSLLVGSVVDDGERPRPSSIEVTVGEVVSAYPDLLKSNGGKYWDTVTIPVTIPANISSLTVQLFSRDDLNTGNLPASLVWVAAGLTVPTPPPPDPEFEFYKQISVDGGATWADANDPDTSGDDTPVAFLSSEVLYRLVIRNTGQVALKGVTVNDAALGILNYPVGDLAINEQKVLTPDQIPALAVKNACLNVRTVENRAEVIAYSAADLSAAGQVIVSDSANLICRQSPCVLPEDPVIYRNDFEGPVGPEWSNTSVDTAPAGQRFLGQFSNQTVQLTLTQKLCPQTLVRLSFDLYIIRSWDGNSIFQPGTSRVIGPDVFDLHLENGSSLFHTTFTNWPDFGGVRLRQAYSGRYPGGDYPAQTGAMKINSLGYTFSKYSQDSIYRLSTSFLYPVDPLNPNDPIKLDFSGSGLQALSDESWGLDNFEIKVEPAGRSIYMPVIIMGAD